jgi:hypothetical protein
MNTTDLFKELGTRLGVPGLAPNAFDACALVAEGGVQVEIRHDPSAERVALCARVMALPEHARAAIQRQVLAANLRPRELDGMHFAMDPEQGELVLCGAVEQPDSDPAPFDEAVKRIVALCLEWRGRLSSASPAF